MAGGAHSGPAAIVILQRGIVYGLGCFPGARRRWFEGEQFLAEETRRSAATGLPLGLRFSHSSARCVNGFY